MFSEEPEIASACGMALESLATGAGGSAVRLGVRHTKWPAISTAMTMRSIFTPRMMPQVCGRALEYAQDLT